MQNCPPNYKYNSKSGICVQCPNDYFAHVVNAEKCYKCPSKSLDCKTGDIPKMRMGYYNYIQNNS